MSYPNSQQDFRHTFIPQVIDAVPSFYDPTLGPPPPHADPDACGAGGNRGIANEYVAYGDWRSTYLTGCDAYGVGHAQFISICDPRRPPLGTQRIVGETKLAHGDRLITAQEAMEFARHGLDEHALGEGTWSEVLRGGKPTEAHLVQRLDRPDEFYYLVTFRRGETDNSVVRLSALYGTFEGAYVVPQGARLPVIDREAALRAARAHAVDLGYGIGRMSIRDGAFCFYPTLVWRPCWESRSPYYPFHQITVGSSVIYVSYDGRVYTTLHDLGGG